MFCSCTESWETLAMIRQQLCTSGFRANKPSGNDRVNSHTQTTSRPRDYHSTPRAKYGIKVGRFHMGIWSLFGLLAARYG
jgi:hypothetical protein